RLIADLNKEQEAFIAGKPGEKGEAVAPWIGAPNEDALREECLALSTDRRNFVRAPPPGVDFAWDFEAVQPMAQATLALDPNLETMRFELVPKVISEENFWRNYFYRVSLLRQSHELNAMANQSTESNPSQLASSDSVDHTQAGATKSEQEEGKSAAPTTKDESEPEVQQVKEAVSKLTVQSKVRSSCCSLPAFYIHVYSAFLNCRIGSRNSMNIYVLYSFKLRTTIALTAFNVHFHQYCLSRCIKEDWERELEAELKDYEVVPGQA
ncbi:hypothetical protein TSAR_008337, partial [Trichomalopsis sarcophagae]